MKINIPLLSRFRDFGISTKYLNLRMNDEEKNKFIEARIEKLIFSAKALSEKYVYYLLAIDAACVGFSVNQSKDLRLTYYQIPLGIAIIFWGISFKYGLNQISKFERQTSLNIRKLKLIISNTPFDNQDNVELYNVEEIIARFRKNQNSYFAFGAFFFIIWHVLRMYNNC
jgi:hypothetical protein